MPIVEVQTSAKLPAPSEPVPTTVTPSALTPLASLKHESEVQVPGKPRKLNVPLTHLAASEVAQNPM